ncbi:uncharacterized protein [Nerophis lumbriciformis]|uniref:uncharacterized protein n=1 Tax=Nerophis lumbriciformis TaxID=546530 RepID=UPI002ADF0F58|nr:cytoskeleton-associated protein 2-like [Nerophis lumbriciformis]
MNNTAVSRQKHPNRKGKENAPHRDGSTSLIKKGLLKSTLTVPLQRKNLNEEEILVKNGPTKATSEQADTKIKSVLKDVKREAVSGAPSQVSLSQRVPPKVAPGLYKGKIVQSKIGSIWKASAVSKTASQSVDTLAKSRSTSVHGVPGRGPEKPAPPRSKSVSDGRVHRLEPTVASRRLQSTLQTMTTATALRNNSSRNTTTGPTKTKVPVTDKIRKPPAKSTLSQHRSTETAEEKRAKLAEWLASKGKTLKRPAMTTAPPKTKTLSTAKADNQIKSVTSKPEAEPKPSFNTENSTAACPPAQEAVMSSSQTSVIMNTTLDLLENSDSDLCALQDGVDSIVVNLCEALEALQTSSQSQEKLPQATDANKDAEEEVGGMEDRSVKKALKSEGVHERVSNETGQKVLTNHNDDDDDQSDEDMRTPHRGQASVVKYSVKTTPYLQSVKKTLEGEVQTSSSRKKSNIKDLKFLTPVRRSCRIQRRSSQLPPMLADHDLCVSSLAELVQLDDDFNAYIYRKNPALMKELPDQPKS